MSNTQSDTSQLGTPHSNTTVKLAVPGKLFLLGEYSVLQGGRAIFAMVKPGYEYELHGEKTFFAHPDSPTGIYEKSVEKSLPIATIPTTMAPGFGSSTAELVAAVLCNLERLPETKRIWAWYREHFPRASGSDLVVQMEAVRKNSALFEYDCGGADALQKSPITENIFVYTISRESKLATHEALKKETPPLDIAKLDAMVAHLKLGLETDDISTLAVFDDFANLMHDAGVETPIAFEVRRAFRAIPGVMSVKGCGAGLNDVFLVAGTNEFGANESAAWAKLAVVAKDFKLVRLGKLSEILW